jgi:hypothetical protein
MAIKRKIDPMPIEDVYLHPEFIAMPPAGRGMLFTLLLHFWCSDCAPIPTSPGDLYGICRPNARVWATHKTVMLKIFNDVSPGMAKEAAFKKSRRAVIRELGARGAGILRLKALGRKQVAHGAREDALPTREANPKERPAAPEQRGGRAKVAPTKGG